MPGVPSTTEEKIQGTHQHMIGGEMTLLFFSAVAKIGHMCWTGKLKRAAVSYILYYAVLWLYIIGNEGGQNATQFATKNYLSLLKSLLDTKEPPHTPLRLVHSYS